MMVRVPAEFLRRYDLLLRKDVPGKASVVALRGNLSGLGVERDPLLRLLQDYAAGMEKSETRAAEVMRWVDRAFAEDSAEDARAWRRARLVIARRRTQLRQARQERRSRPRPAKSKALGGPQPTSEIDPRQILIELVPGSSDEALDAMAEVLVHAWWRQRTGQRRGEHGTHNTPRRRRRSGPLLDG